MLRVTRIIKLVRKAKGLQSLIETLSVSIKPISNVCILLMLVYYLFSIVGNKLFDGTVYGDA